MNLSLPEGRVCWPEGRVYQPQGTNLSKECRYILYLFYYSNYMNWSLPEGRVGLPEGRVGQPEGRVTIYIWTEVYLRVG